MKKKLISMVVVSAMCLGMLAGCGKSSEPAEEPAPAEDSEPTEGSEPAADEEKPLRIAYSVQSLDNEYFVTISLRKNKLIETEIKEYIKENKLEQSFYNVIFSSNTPFGYLEVKEISNNCKEYIENNY